MAVCFSFTSPAGIIIGIFLAASKLLTAVFFAISAGI